jgi:hypothetical protein
LVEQLTAASTYPVVVGIDFAGGAAPPPKKQQRPIAQSRLTAPGWPRRPALGVGAQFVDRRQGRRL